MSLGLIGLSTKTLRSVAPSSTWAASYLHPCSAAFITTIAESSFQYTQARARLHADQAARNIGEIAFELSARDLLLQKDRPALIEADKMEAILADVDADRADGGWCGFV